MKELTESTLREMVATIVDAISPEKIILFGSRARGQAGPVSDIDFLIVDSCKNDEDRDEAGLLGNLWNLLRKFGFSIDMLLFSTDEVEQWRDSRYHIVGVAFREGTVVYERT